MSRYAVPCGIIAFCLGAFYLTTQFDRVPPLLLRGMQPADFPQLVLITIIVLAVVVMIRPGPRTADAGWKTSTDDDADNGHEGPETVVKHAPVSGHVWGSMALLLVFAAVAQIDLFLGLGVFAVSLSWLWGERRWWAFLIVMILAPLFIFFLFDQVFEVRFPRGLLTNLWYR